jgi:O-antigen ligase
MPWLFVAWWNYGTSRRQRQWCVIVFVIALAPVLYSLDRGLWLGIACTMVYLAVRFAARGKLAMLGIFCGVVALAGVVIITTPAGNLITSRLQNGKSNAVRGSLSGIAVQDALSSPIIGYGDTRHELGSTNSIVVGRTQNCKSCGSRSIGGNGQLWMLLVTNGLLGTGLYLGFFGYAVWRFRRDKTPYGTVGVLVILLGYVFMVTYQAVGPPISFTLLAFVLLWRNDTVIRQEKADQVTGAEAPDGLGRPGPGLDGGPRVITAGAT